MRNVAAALLAVMAFSAVAQDAALDELLVRAKKRIAALLSSPEDASAYIRSETLKWAKVISDGRITVE